MQQLPFFFVIGYIIQIKLGQHGQLAQLVKTLHRTEIAHGYCLVDSSYPLNKSFQMMFQPKLLKPLHDSIL